MQKWNLQKSACDDGVKIELRLVLTQFGATLESLISVPLVIRVPQPHGGVKIVLYDMLIEIRLS